MEQQSLPLGATANLRFAFAEDGALVPGLAPTFTWFCDTTSSANYGKFYDFANGEWSATTVENALAPVAGNPGIYGANASQSGLSSAPEAYIVRMQSNSVAHPHAEVIRLTFGDSLIELVEDLHQYMLAPRRELHRIDGDTTIQERSFNARTGGTEIFRFTHVQDPSGAQPEETRTNDTTLIGD